MWRAESFNHRNDMIYLINAFLSVSKWITVRYTLQTRLWVRWSGRRTLFIGTLKHINQSPSSLRLLFHYMLLWSSIRMDNAFTFEYEKKRRTEPKNINIYVKWNWTNAARVAVEKSMAMCLAIDQSLCDFAAVRIAFYHRETVFWGIWVWFSVFFEHFNLEITVSVVQLLGKSDFKDFSSNGRFFVKAQINRRLKVNIQILKKKLKKYKASYKLSSFQLSDKEVQTNWISPEIFDSRDVHLNYNLKKLQESFKLWLNTYNK